MLSIMYGKIYKNVRKIFVVDDYSNRNHYCDYYLNYHYDNVSLTGVILHYFWVMIILSLTQIL